MNDNFDNKENNIHDKEKENHIFEENNNFNNSRKNHINNIGGNSNNSLKNNINNSMKENEDEDKNKDDEFIFNNNIHNNDNDFNLINNDEDNEKKEYSFECINKNHLNREIFEGEKEIKINIMMKNNKNITWPENNTKLVFDFNSNFVQNDINLLPQKFNEMKNYEIVINDLGEYPPGDYNVYLRFEVNGEQYGERIEIKLVIKEKQNDDLIKLNKFRKLFNLPEKDYTTENLLALLKKHNFDCESAFMELINNN
jgi:hypothetical protein